jgi:ketosteroid isomerase-like protein
VARRLRYNRGMATQADALRERNALFYRALEELNLELMGSVWSRGAGIRCIHPGWDVLEGWPDIRDSFAQIFAGTAWLRVTPTQVGVLDFGAIGLVSCSENITTTHDGNVGVAVAQATNLFHSEGGEWKLVLHHASLAPVPVTEPANGKSQ